MMPMYRYMDQSHPNQRYQQSFPAYIPSNAPMVYDSSWPYSGACGHGYGCGYGFPNSMPFSSCCSHGSFPAFHGFRPSCPQPIPTPMPFYAAPAPSYPAPYPVHYAHPSPNCCVWPNHQCGDRAVKIQEPEPDVEPRKGNGSQLVPVRLRDYPGAVVWVPEENLREKRPDGAESVNSRGSESSNWDGWFPPDRDKIKYLMSGEDEKRARDQKSEERKKEFPFPLIWMPYDDDGKREESERKENKGVNGDQVQKSEDQMKSFPFPIIWVNPQDKRQNEAEDKDGQEANASPKPVQNSPYVFKFVPVKHLGGENSLENSQLSEEKEKTAAKDIKVERVDPPKEEEKKSEENETKSKALAAENSKSSSVSPKSSKLPPVCLRVDPLPKKKNGKGSSRLPSPPSSKRQSQEESNASVLSNQKAVEPKTRDTEVMARDQTSNVEKHKPSEVTEDPKVPTHFSLQTKTELPEKLTVEKSREVSDECRAKEMAETEKATDSAISAHEISPRKKILSDEEAALRIQSVYRGFEVRRSQPLKKLKQIAEVREQVAEVRNGIEGLELSSSGVPKDDKRKLVLGETIMRLLLKLDTIQGLHSSLRDIRKSLAKELVTLQERLDSVVIEPEKPKVEICTSGHVEAVGSELERDESKQEKQQETEGSQSSKDISKSACYSEPGEDQAVPAMDSEQRFKNGNDSFASSGSMALNVESEGDRMKDQVGSDLKPEEPISEATTEPEDEKKDVCIMEPVEKEKVNEAPKVEEACESPLEEDINDSNSPVEKTCSLDMETGDDESPNEIVNEKHAAIDNGEELGLAMAFEFTSPGEVEEVTAMEEDAQMHELAEQAIVAIDEDNECLATSETTLQLDETPNEIKKSQETLGDDLTSEAMPNKELEESEPQISLEEEDSQLALQEREKIQEVPEEKSEPQISLEEEDSQLALQEREKIQEVPEEKYGQENEHLQEAMDDESQTTNEETNGESETRLNCEKNKEDDENLQEVTTEEGKHETGETKAHVTKYHTNDEKPNESKTKNEEVLGVKELAPSPLEEEKECPLDEPEKQLVEENEKLKKMMEKLIEAGQEQLNVISKLNGRVKDLEKKLSKRNKKVTPKCRPSRAKAKAM